MAGEEQPPVSNVEEDEVVAESSGYSDLGESIETDYTSLSSSILNHVYENGRRYHSLNAGTYVLPNDEREQERLDMFHHATSLLLGGELHAVALPENLHRVLDVGTGTGIWAIDFADTHPDAHVIGVDLSPIQPSWVPPNCSFEVDDIEKPWVWKEPFDFIHSANLAQGIRNWPRYTQRIYNHLAPGGVVQLHENRTVISCDDDTIPKGGYIEEYQRVYNKAAELAGIKEVSQDLEGYLKDAGFVDIRVVVKKMPIGPWPKERKKKEVGRWGLLILEQGLKSYGVAIFTRHLGMAPEDATALCDNVFKELSRRDVHTYLSQWFVEGRKPKSQPE